MSRPMIKRILIWHWHMVSNPYFWLSCLAFMVAAKTVEAATGQYWVGFAFAVVGQLLVIRNSDMDAAADWRGERLLRRLLADKVAEEVKFAQGVAAKLRSNGNDACIEFAADGRPILIANYVNDQRSARGGSKL